MLSWFITFESVVFKAGEASVVLSEFISDIFRSKGGEGEGGLCNLPGAEGAKKLCALSLTVQQMRAKDLLRIFRVG